MTALLESDELIVRGAIRERAPRASLERVQARGEILAFVVGGEAVEFDLGTDPARRWAEAIAAAPPTLASKLGVSRTTRVCVTGTLDDDAVRETMRARGFSDTKIAAVSERLTALRFVRKLSAPKR